MKKQHYFEFVVGILGVIGLFYFGWESPETRENINALYLAGVWFLMVLSTVSAYFDWNSSKWPRKIFAIIAPLMVLLYLAKYLQG